MADNTTVHIAENSPEQVAYKLLERIAAVESRPISIASYTDLSTLPDRKWILDTYAECLIAVKAPEIRQ